MTTATHSPRDVALASHTMPEAVATRFRLPHVETSRFIAFWLGLPMRTGAEDSNTAVAAALADVDDVADRGIADLDGMFVLLVYDKRGKTWSVYGDSNGILPLYYDDIGCSTSILGMLSDRTYTIDDLDRRAVVDFYLHGAMLSRRTLLRPVHRLPRRTVLVLRSEGGAAVRPLQDVAKAAEDSETCVERYFADHARLLGQRRVTVLLTGGSDSRWLFCLARHHLARFRTVIAGEPHSAEVAVAEKVAATAEVSLDVVPETVANIDEDLETMFLDGDGVVNLVQHHRTWQMACHEGALGQDVLIHGGGGGIFRDTFSYQDIPIYFGKPNIEKFYRLRLSLSSAVPPFTEPVYVREIRREVLDRMHGIASADKHRTYNEIYLIMKAPWLYGSIYAMYRRRGLDVFAPFLDGRNVAVALARPIVRKMFHRWHRRVVSRRCPQLARIPMTTGMTLSDAPLDMLVDAAAYMRDVSLRVVNKLAWRWWGRSPFAMGASAVGRHPDLAEAVRGARVTERALGALAAAGILHRDQARERALTAEELGRLVTVGLLVERLTVGTP